MGTAPPRDPGSTDEIVQFQCRVRFESRDPAKNRARFYTLTWQPALWGGGALVRSWGRLGSSGRSLTTFYPDRASAQERIDRLIRHRLRRGYHVVGWQ